MIPEEVRALSGFFDFALVISWTLFGFTAANMWLLGSKRREGFIVGLAAQPIWLVFDWHVGAYGLMPLALILGGLYLRGVCEVG